MCGCVCGKVRKSCKKLDRTILWGVVERQKWLSFSGQHCRRICVSAFTNARAPKDQQTAERHSGRIYWIRKIYSHIDFSAEFMLTIGLNYEKYTMKRTHTLFLSLSLTLASNFIVCCIIHILLCKWESRVSTAFFLGFLTVRLSDLAAADSRVVTTFGARSSVELLV